MFRPISKNKCEGDRFIPKRQFLDLNLFHYKYPHDNEEQSEEVDILCQAVESKFLSSYQKSVKDAILPNVEQGSNILPFYISKPPIKIHRKVTHWPVQARKKPCIGRPDAVLDFPLNLQSIYSNVLDWGMADIIATSTSGYLYFWDAPTNRSFKFRLKNYGLNHISCLKWHPNGNIIAYASTLNYLVMLDVRTHKIIADFKNICHINCYVSSIDFHPHLHHLVVGCSQGNVMELHKKLLCKSSSSSHNGTVLMLAFSYDGTYLASYASDKYILVVRSKEIIFRVRTHHPCTGFAWHPWRASHLVVGYTNGQMTLYNVASNKTLTSYIPSIEQDSVILGLTFSKLTGELVTSHRINTESNCTQLNVLESFDRVVDRLSGNFGKIFYLKWSPDGTKLATAGSDEKIYIWNFLPSSKTSSKSKMESKYGNRLGTVYSGIKLNQTSIPLSLIR